MIHPLLLLLSSFTASTTGHTLQQTSRQRHRILKETTAPPTVNDRLTSSAFNVNGDACSCSPTKFTFRINLSQSCNNDDISENAGIKTTFCSIDDISGTNTSEDSNQEPLRQLKTSSLVEITSVQFLEFRPDPSLEVTYTDDTYLNATLTNGDTFTFYSSSSYLPSVSTEEQDEYVPGGVSLILHGRTEDGTVKRNRLYWLYDQAVTDCLENLIIPGIYVDDAIGWVVVDAVAGPWPQFCPAASPTSPTITPRTFDPTAAPTSYSVFIETSKSSKSSFVELGSKSDKEQVDSKAGKYGSKSSTNSVYVPQDNSSIEDKESVDLSSKSGKSSYSANSNPEPKSMSYSLSMGPSSDSSGSPSSNELYYHDYKGSKTGKAEVDSKAVKNTSKASKNSGPSYVSKTDKGVTIDDLSKSGKAHDTSDNTMTSSTHWKSSADSPEAQAQDVSAKANGYNTKAYKILSPGAKTGKGTVLSSKSNKSEVIADPDEVASVSTTHSLSMSSNAPSPSSAYPQNNAHFIESKADKNSGESSKVEHWAEASVAEATWSKSSKSYDIGHTAIEPASMSYSLSLPSRPSHHQYHESTGNIETHQSNGNISKSGKAERNARDTASRSRDLKSERAAIDDVDCTGTECIDCFPVSSAPIIDGGTFDWVSVQSFESPLTHALDRSEYTYGNLKMKCVHDSKRIYFLFEVPGPFRFDPENNHRCPSVSTMFKMGPDAMYYNMGNCPHAATSCADDPSLCTDYKVDIGGHWEMRRTEMGVKYGINEEAGDGNIANEYAFSPYCHGDDNDQNASNDWEGSWIHTSPVEGDLGTYIFEMSRSLKTASSVTDAQLELGEAIDFGFAYWDPYELSNGWTHAGHYVTGGSVEWLSLRLIKADITEAPTPMPIDPSTKPPTPNPTKPSTKEPTPTPISTSSTSTEPRPSTLSSSSVDTSETSSPVEHQVDAEAQKYSSKSTKIEPHNEPAWAEFSFSKSPTAGKAGKQDPGLISGKEGTEAPTTQVPLETTSSKSGKGMPLDHMKSVQPSSGPAAFQPSIEVQTTLHQEFQSSKSSKSKETHASAAKAGKSDHDYAPLYVVSKSGKFEHTHNIVSSMSHSLSMSSSYSLSEEEESNETGLKQTSFETDQATDGSKAKASSPSVDTGFGFTSDNTSTVSEIRSPNSGATLRNLATALVLLFLQLAI